MARKPSLGSLSPGLDRTRIGERLEASLAGLQELYLLREKQRATVRRALSEERRDQVRRSSPHNVDSARLFVRAVLCTIVRFTRSHYTLQCILVWGPVQSSGVRPLLTSHPTAPVAQGLDPSPHTPQPL
uniref:Uncharacterized protein n=1 Tax=Callorhinchus milii TaxID=7868 RepID=A0A4W3H2A3_CALMI